MTDSRCRGYGLPSTDATRVATIRLVRLCAEIPASNAPYRTKIRRRRECGEHLERRLWFMRKIRPGDHRIQRDVDARSGRKHNPDSEVKAPMEEVLTLARRRA